jgi:hypothetical protein
VIAAPRPRRLNARGRITAAARAIEPILNRVVLAGPPVVELLTNDPSMSGPLLSFTADQTLRLLATSMVDRLGGDLQKLGLTRTGRAGNSERWRVSDEVEIELMQVRSDDGDPAQLSLEYATLLTLPFGVSDQLTVRIAGAPPMLAIECVDFTASGASALDSEALERAVLVIAGRREIEKEFAAAPAELRAIIVPVLAELGRNDSLELLIQRALPDAAMLPALADRVRDRIVRMAC